MGLRGLGFNVSGDLGRCSLFLGSEGFQDAGSERKGFEDSGCVASFSRFFIDRRVDIDPHPLRFEPRQQRCLIKGPS